MGFNAKFSVGEPVMVKLKVNEALLWPMKIASIKKKSMILLLLLRDI